MVRARESWMRRIYRRSMPQSIGGRLTVTVVMLALATATVTVISTSLALTWQTGQSARAGVTAELGGFQSFLHIEQHDLSTDLSRLAGDPSIVSATLTRDPERLAASISSDTSPTQRVEALLIVDDHGALVYSYGPDSVLARLRPWAAADIRVSRMGNIGVPGATSVTAAEPITSGAGRPVVGAVAEVRTVDQDSLSRFVAITADAEASLLPPGSSLPGALSSQTATGYSAVAYRTTSGVMHAYGTLVGVDGGSAGIVAITDVDTRAQSAERGTLYASLIAGAAALLLGAALGLTLARTIRRPFERLVDHVKNEGYLAAEGVPYAGGDPTDDTAMPREIRELSAVVEDLLEHLTARQAELKDAIRQAEYAEDTLGVVVSESLEAKVVIQDGRIIVANPAASVALGQPVTAMLDKTLTEVLDGATLQLEDRTPLDAAALIESALSGPVEYRYVREDVPERWYLAQAARHADDLHNRILITMRDVTEDRRLQGIRNEILSLISHDLRAPLTVVTGYLDLLTKPLEDEDRVRAIDAARRNAERMSDLLDDLLSATRAEELLAPSTLAPVALPDLAQEVVSSLQTTVERAITLDVRQPAVVLGEEKRLRQVLFNLVTNALKYSPPESPVRVIVDCVGDRASLIVEDHGPGVPPQDRTRIFDRFTRLESPEAHTSGIGLGLYIVRIIAENHGGSARVEETGGGGARFVVDLPAAARVVSGSVVLGGHDAVEDEQPSH
jgi:signal transduction histidine kinase